ncbi:uncharacterized protein (UPF0548 family) [Halopolyspora algeriensis]|uniref:Uncharacterized protein (UPF0548 family) n=1 Tax=Halopolyspora algeriensis TaxID=1500506 RepID=A0A368VID0_9ACTN|nr:DUF1990 domain-containing protein [Halopolyspora algeriensis]RCW41017.1 uncharacterized protein (UPF0548 family) [Halopolyspora algeriensis]TQM53899.1 uncharacterized protein (UPF0548 family) [Halopolyspora algeriensis]
MDLEHYRSLPLTYRERGATEGRLPHGYRHLSVRRRVGTGRELFETLSQHLMRWGMQRGLGVEVDTTSAQVVPDAELVLRRGPLRIPCRVVYVVDELDRRGFAYGTLPGHPLVGEELFAITYDPASGDVYASVTSFARPAHALLKALGPFVGLGQKLMARLYLRRLAST